MSSKGYMKSKYKPVKIKFLVNSIQTGSTPSTKVESYYDGNINWFTPGDFNDCSVLTKANKTISQKAIHDKESRLFEANTLAIIGIGGTLGKVALLKEQGSFNQQITGITTRDILNPKFLYYWLSVNRDLINKTANYTTLPIINNQFIKELKCPMPQIDIQSKIIAYLDHNSSYINKIIQNKEKLTVLLEQQRQSIVTEAVTKGLNPKVKMKDSGVEWIGEIPEHWKLIKSKFIFEEVSHKGFSEKKLLSVSKGRGLIPRDEMENKVVMAFKDLENFKLVRINDFVIHLRSFQSGFEFSEIEGIVSPAYTVFRMKTQGNHKYYKYVFYSKVFIEAIASTTQSLRDGKPIAYSDFAGMLMMLPTPEEQNKIADYIDTKLCDIDRLIKLTENQIEKLKEYRQSLIYEAVTGKIDVRDMELD